MAKAGLGRCSLFAVRECRFEAASARSRARRRSPSCYSAPAMLGSTIRLRTLCAGMVVCGC